MKSYSKKGKNVLEKTTEQFVFEGTEVKKTGRRAVKTIPKPKGGNWEYVIYEVTPVDGTGWLKWVDEKELYKIEDLT